VENKLINKNNIRWTITGIVIALIGYVYRIIVWFLGLFVAFSNFDILNWLTSLNEAWLNVIVIMILLAISIGLIVYFYKKGFIHKFKNWICLIVGNILGAIMFLYLIVPILTTTVTIFQIWNMYFGLFSIWDILLWLFAIVLWMTICYFIAWAVGKKRKVSV